LALREVGIELAWEGTGLDEVGTDKQTGKKIIGIDPYYFRPTEVDLLIGDPSKAKRELGWEAKTKFEDLVKMMMDAEKKNFKI